MGDFKKKTKALRLSNNEEILFESMDSPLNLISEIQ